MDQLTQNQGHKESDQKQRQSYEWIQWMKIC